MLNLFVALLVLALPLAVRGQLIFQTNGNNTITVSGYDGGSDNVVIPASVGGLPVVEIGTQAFRSSSVSNVVIPNSVTVIRAGVFGFSSIQSVNIPDSVTSLGSGAFFSTPLTSVTLGAGLTNIDIEAFDSCYQLTGITVSPSNTTFSSSGGALFDKNKTVLYQFPAGFTGGYTIPGTVTNVIDYAMSGCKFSSLTIPDSLVSAGNTSFRGCHNVTNFTVGAGNPTFASSNGVLFNKTFTTLLYYPVGNAASSYAVPNGVTFVNHSAFEYGIWLKSVTIPNSVTSIGQAAFQNCTTLTNLTVGTGLTFVNNYAFSYCYTLTSAYFQGNAPGGGVGAFYASPTTVYRYLSGTGWGSMYDTAPVVLLAPHLNINRAGTNVVLSWLTNSAAGFNLQFSTNLSTSAWSTNLPVPVTVSGQSYVTNPAAVGQKFFRLD